MGFFHKVTALVAARPCRGATLPLYKWNFLDTFGVASETPAGAMAFLQRITVRRSIGIVGGLIIIGIVTIGVRWLSEQTAASTTTSSRVPPTLPVTAAAAVRQNFPDVIETIGTVQSIDVVSIEAQVYGPIVKIEFEPGQDVKKGQELFLIDPRPFQALLDQTKAQLARDQAALAQAQLDLARYQTLAQQKSIAVQTAQDQAFVVEQDKAALALDQANVDTAQINLDYCHIKSPIDGRAGILQIELGNIVGPFGIGTTTSIASGVTAAPPTAGAPTAAATTAPAATAAGQSPSSGVLVSISQIKPIYVNFPVAQTLFDEVKKYQATSPLEVDAYSQSGKQIGKGKLTVIDNQVNASTGTVSMQATFANADQALWPGEFVRVELIVSILRNVVTVPAQAVMMGPSGSYVYVIGPDQTVHRANVEVAARRHDVDVIEKGVAEGQRVVTDGQYRLSNGAKVDVTKLTEANVALR
jgi:membrane fusion protein, multidrug efflux system